jgi:hypothetical protein
MQGGGGDKQKCLEKWPTFRHVRVRWTNTLGKNIIDKLRNCFEKNPVDMMVLEPD